jgi:hypothetical protein
MTRKIREIAPYVDAKGISWNCFEYDGEPEYWCETHQPPPPNRFNQTVTEAESLATGR